MDALTNESVSVRIYVKDEGLGPLWVRGAGDVAGALLSVGSADHADGHVRVGAVHCKHDRHAQSAPSSSSCCSKTHASP